MERRAKSRFQLAALNDLMFKVSDDLQMIPNSSLNICTKIRHCVAPLSADRSFLVISAGTLNPNDVICSDRNGSTEPVSACKPQEASSLLIKC